MSIFLHGTSFVTGLTMDENVLSASCYISREAQPRRNVQWPRPSVCLCVCLSLAAFPHCCMDPDVTWRNGRGVLQLCNIGRICNRCTGFVAMITYTYVSLQPYIRCKCVQRRTRNVSECLYSLCACLMLLLMLYRCCSTSVKLVS